jgi:hypothetical protein
MRIARAVKHFRAGEKVKLAIIDADEQTRRMQEAVAHRAYAIFESRGSAGWHELEDWRQAESDLITPLCCGQMTVGDNLWIGADIAALQEGTIEVWIAPRKITVCGMPCVDKMDDNRKHLGPRPDEEMIFHVRDLTVEIDPFHVTAKVNGPSLEILLKKAQAKLRDIAHASAV